MKHFSVFTYTQHFEEQRIFQFPDPFNRFYWDSHAYLVPITVNCDPDTLYIRNWTGATILFHRSQILHCKFEQTTEDKSLSRVPNAVCYPFLNEYVNLILDFCTKVPISVFITTGFVDIYIYICAQWRAGIERYRWMMQKNINGRHTIYKVLGAQTKMHVKYSESCITLACTVTEKQIL